MSDTSSNHRGSAGKLLTPRDADKFHMGWDFEDQIFDNIFDFEPVETSLCSPALVNLVNSSNTISTMEEFSTFRKSLLNHVSVANKHDMILVSQLVRMTLVFLTSPLSDGEMEQLRQIRIDEDSKAQLVFHASNPEIIEFNKKILPIFTKMPSDIPSIDTSGMPLMGVNVIQYTLLALKWCTGYTKAPLLMSAANSFFVAAPKLIFAEYKYDVYNFYTFVGPMFNYFDCQYVQLFYESLDSRFNYEMATDWINIILETGDFGEEYMEYIRLYAMICAISINKETKEHITPNGKNLWDMLHNIIDGGRDEVLWFLRALDPKRLLYRMKSVHAQTCRPFVDGFDSDENEEEIQQKQNILSEAMSTVLMEHLNAMWSIDGPKKRLICMLIEFITAWTDSANLMINLALRWATITDDHRAAVTVVDMLMDLIDKKTDFLLKQPAINPPKNSFLKQTCNGVIFPVDIYRFVDVALKTKKECIATFGQFLHSIPDEFDILKVVRDSSSLSARLSGLYFQTSSALTGIKVPLKLSFHNLSVDDLTDQNYPENGPEIMKVRCTIFEFENHQYSSRSILVMSQSKFYGIKREEPKVDAEPNDIRGRKRKRDTNELYQIVLKSRTRQFKKRCIVLDKEK